MALLKMVLHLVNTIYHKSGNDYCKAIKNNITSIIKIAPEYAVKYYHPLFINDNADLKSLKSKVLSIDESIYDVDDYNVPLVKTQMKKIIVTAKTLYSHPKNVSKIYAALHTDLAW